MAGNIKGITIEIGGNVSPLNKALDGVNNKSKDLQSELKQVERLLKLDPGNTTLLAQKQELLAKSVGNTKDKLDTLKEAEKQVQAQFKKGEVSEEQYRALQREIAQTEINLSSMKTEAIKANAVLSKEDATNNLKNMGKVAAVGAAATAAAFVGMAVEAVNNADELQRQADVTGFSAERLQELAYVGNNLGVELETITGAQAKLTKSMAAAKDGTGAQAEAFKTLGISVTDGNGNLKDSKLVMEEAFTALNGVGNETERDAIAMAIFGKSAMEMNPLIKAGGDQIAKLSDDARKNGAVMSNEAVAGLDSFGDTVDNLKNSILGAFGEKFAEMLPKIQEFLDKLKELPKWIEKNSTLLTIIGVVIGTIITLIIAFNIQQALMASGMTLWTAIGAGATAVTTALATAMAFLTSPIALVILAIGAVIAVGVLLYKNWDTIKEKATEIFGYVGDFVGGAIEKIKGFFLGIIDFVKNNWQGILLFIVNPFAGAFKLLYDNLDGFRNKVDSIFTGVKDFIGGAIEKIKGFFSFDWELPKIKLPHFNIKGKFSLSPPQIPKLDVDWYDKGGIFSAPSIIGVGEKRPEFVGALDDLRYLIRDELKKGNGNNTGAITVMVNSILDGNIVAKSVNKVNLRNDRRYNP